MAPTICTIIAKNYLAQARVLCDSFLEYHPDGRVIVLVIDPIEEQLDPQQERFSMLQLADIAFPSWQRMTFCYNVVELSTAVKPYLLARLFEDPSVDQLCYIDPDVLICSPMQELWDALAHTPIVLTPHLTHELADGYTPDERTMLMVGSYNLGFIGLRRSPEVDRLLTWWQAKLRQDCRIDLANGLFVDQRWIDLVPGLFDGVFVLRHPGYNVAYWNLSHRQLERDGSLRMAAAAPLRFFHFSGYNPASPEVVSRHQNRFVMSDLSPETQAQFAEYRDLLYNAGYGEAHAWEYHYACFDNGVRIHDLMRPLYEHADPDMLRWPDPFHTGIAQSFQAWLNEPASGSEHSTPLITNMAYHVYLCRSDLQISFPAVFERSRQAYAEWFVESVERDHGLDSIFIEPIRISLLQSTLDQTLAMAAAPPDLRTLLFLLAIRVSYTAPALFLRGILGRATVRSLKRRLYAWKGLPLSKPSASIAEAAARQRAPAVSGVTVIGYLRSETGVGEAARSSLRALQAAAVPVSGRNITIADLARQGDAQYDSLDSHMSYSTNLWHVNADQVPFVHAHLGAAHWPQRRNIGFWYWELEQFPNYWHDRFRYFDEIWVASTFTQAALTPHTSLPVIVMRPSIEVLAPPLSRTQLTLPEGRFLFLFAFDMFSIPERKNPLAVIEAYRRAFGSSQETNLVIKVNNLQRLLDSTATLSAEDRRYIARFRDEAARAGVTLIEETLDRAQVFGLYQQCDSFVSLHRAEGFGLSLAECMYLGKPCVATGYSSNTEFMTHENSYLVNYDLVQLTHDYGPYRRGMRWADPDVAHAAELMRSIVEHPAEAQRKAAQAAQDIRSWHSPHVVGQAMAARLNR